MNRPPLTPEQMRWAVEALAPTFVAHVKDKATIAAGRAIAAVLKEKVRADVTDEEALDALKNYRNEGDEELKHAAARAGVGAMLSELEAGGYIPLEMVAEVIHAFQGLDVGAVRGIAQPAKNKRRIGAADYDALARFVAAEVFHTKALHRVRSDDLAMMMATGVIRDDRKTPVDVSLATVPLHAAGVAWGWLERLFKRGCELLGEGGKEDAQAAALALVAGEEVHPDFNSWRQHWLKVFADPANVRAVVLMSVKSRPPRPAPAPKRRRKRSRQKSLQP